MPTLSDVESRVIAEARAASPEPMLLDLGCGYAELPAEGFLGVDYYARGERIKNVDLFSYPWPFADDSVDMFTSSHFLEHVPDWDAHFAEIWRCLKPRGTYRVLAPYAKSDRYLQDPTHRTPVTHERLAYLNQGWIRAQKLEHGRPSMNFSEVAHGYAWYPDIADYMDGATQEARMRTLARQWNVAQDIFFIVRKEDLLP